MSFQLGRIRFSRHPLNFRQRQILVGVCLGMRNGQLADALNVSESVVKLQVHKLEDRFGVRRKVELMQAGNAAVQESFKRMREDYMKGLGLDKKTWGELADGGVKGVTGDATASEKVSVRTTRADGKVYQRDRFVGGAHKARMESFPAATGTDWIVMVKSLPGEALWERIWTIPEGGRLEIEYA